MGRVYFKFPISMSSTGSGWMENRMDLESSNIKTMQLMKGIYKMGFLKEVESTIFQKVITKGTSKMGLTTVREK